MKFLSALSLFVGMAALASPTGDLWARAIFLQVDPALTNEANFNANDGRHFEAALRSAHPPLLGHSQVKVRESERTRAPIYVSYGDFCFGPDLARNTRALHYYVSAATRDPDCIEAWYRISQNTLVSDDFRDKALKACMRLEPNNALHYYNIATHLHAMGNHKGALDCIQKGNDHPLSIMRPLVPDEFELAVPMAGYLCFLGIEGQPVTREFLASLATGFQAADLPLTRKIRAMVADLTATGEPVYLEACGQMGLALILNGQRDVIFSSVGFGIVRELSPALSAHYEKTEQPEKRASIVTILDAQAIYMERLTPVLTGYDDLPTPASRLQNMREVMVHGRRTTGVADACLVANGVTNVSRLD
jgi:hypothetical protein